MGLMALINLIVIVVLSEPVIKLLKDYDRQIKQGASPVFHRERFPFLDKTIDNDVWGKTGKNDSSDTDGNDSAAEDLPEAEGF